MIAVTAHVSNQLLYTKSGWARASLFRRHVTTNPHTPHATTDSSSSGGERATTIALLPSLSGHEPIFRRR